MLLDMDAWPCSMAGFAALLEKACAARQLSEPQIVVCGRKQFSGSKIRGSGVCKDAFIVSSNYLHATTHVLRCAQPV